MRMNRGFMIDVVTVATGVSAIAVAVVVLMGFLKQGPSIRQRENSRIENWEEYKVGHRWGPLDAPVTIVEWGDYECNPCRVFHTSLKEVMDSFPDQISVVWRHWPLKSHKFAYPAARAAECAGEQDVFHAFHDRLMEDQNWLGNAFIRFATASGVQDSDAFEECLGRVGSVPAIERDLEAAERFGARATPAIIFNGVYLGRTPTREELEALVREAIG